MAEIDYRFVNLFVNDKKLINLIKPYWHKKQPCFSPNEHHLFDRIWVLKRYEEFLKMLKVFKELKDTKNSPGELNEIITYEEQIPLYRYLTVKFCDLINILLTSFFDVFNTIKLAICFNDFLLYDNLSACIWLIIRIMELLLSMYPFKTMDIISLKDYGFYDDITYIKLCAMILANPQMDNIQINFNSIQYIDSLIYDDKEEYLIKKKLEEACEDHHLAEISVLLKELSEYYIKRGIKGKKSLICEKKEATEIQDKEVEIEGENKIQFKLPRWFNTKVFNGPRNETKPQKFQNYHTYKAKMINNQIKIAQFLELNKKVHNRVDPKFQQISEIEFKISKDSMLKHKKLLGIKLHRNNK